MTHRPSRHRAKTLQVIVTAFFVLQSVSISAEERPEPLDFSMADRFRAFYERTSPQWPEVPRETLLALVAAEDRLFFEKPLQNSAITSQIARMIGNPGDGKLQRFFDSVSLAGVLSHEEILNWYANEMFFGQSCYGIADAAEAYFGKSVDGLNSGESAFLAGVIKSPVLLHPNRSYERALERRNFVLAEMRSAGFLSVIEVATASAAPLVFRDPLGQCEKPETPQAGGEGEQSDSG